MKRPASLAFGSGIWLPGHAHRVCIGNMFKHAWPDARFAGRSEVPEAEFVHELGNEGRALLPHDLLSGPELRRTGAPVESPVAQAIDDEQCLNPCLGRAVANALPAGAILVTQYSVRDEAF